MPMNEDDVVITVRAIDLVGALHNAYVIGAIAGIVCDDFKAMPLPLVPKEEKAEENPRVAAFVRQAYKAICKQRKRKDGTRQIPRVFDHLSELPQ